MKKLDLHGVKHSDVSKLIDQFICENNTEKELTIITGNSDTMKELVISCIKEYGYDYSVGDFLGVNTGYIKIF
jgi:DNA-nicking Smr family endonuclease